MPVQNSTGQQMTDLLRDSATQEAAETLRRLETSPEGLGEEEDRDDANEDGERAGGGAGAAHGSLPIRTNRTACRSVRRRCKRRYRSKRRRSPT